AAKVLAGDNKFLCAQCNKKRDTLKRTCIARLPNVLILHLKRFEFDMELMRKVNTSYEYKQGIDHDLDHLDPYLQLQNSLQDLYGTDPTEEP
ncbi:unnamed protein product, partial [Laminaria digitata]